MGDTGEVPLSLKGYRLMINFWHRVRAMSDDTLAKKALLENTRIRSNWISTIEKLLTVFGIQFTENNLSFKQNTKRMINLKYIECWENSLTNIDTPRLYFYKHVKKSFGFEPFLDLLNF